MSETSFASLSSTLLARKGGAKPAMRPQSTSLTIDGKQAAAGLEDLGWNDMGDAEGGRDDLRADARVVSLKHAGDTAGTVASPVRETIERIAERLEAPGRRPAARAGESARPKPRSARRAAFTLRLDPHRHLKLRLACTVHGKSAQALVTDALDALLAEMPEIDNLAAQVSRG